MANGLSADFRVTSKSDSGPGCFWASAFQQLCEEWLLEVLAGAGEPVRPAELIDAARAAGFSQMTLYRARRALAAALVDVGTGLRDPHKAWALAPLP